MDIEDIIWPIIRMMNGDGSMRESDYGNIIDSLRGQRDEITQLRADLAAERELADRLASSVEWLLSETETNRGDEPMDDHRGLSWNQINEYWIHHEDIAADALTAHATRRSK